MVIYLLPVTRKTTKNNVRFETEAWNNWEITHCSDTFYLRASCPGSSLCLVIERSWEWGCLLTRRFRRRHSCDMCCSHISDVTYWQWLLNHIWHYTFKHTPHKLKKERYIFKNHHHHNIMSGLCTYQCNAGGGERQGMGWGFDCLCCSWGRAFDWSCSPGGGDIWIFLHPTWRYLTADSDEKD